MKITDIKAIPIRLPVRRDFRWAGLEEGIGGFVYVRIDTDEGVVGHGEATPLPDWGGDFGARGGESQRTVVSMIEHVIKPVLIGCDPTAIEAAHIKMGGVLRGNNYAKCAVDIALHDILGKVADLPLYKLLGGGVRNTVKISHMVGIMPIEEAVAEARDAVADGVTALQIKGGEDYIRDVEVAKRIRQSVGSEIFLRLDANQGYRNPKLALLALQAMKGNGNDRCIIDVIEQPVEGVEQMAFVTSKSPIPVIADESCWDASDALNMIKHRGCDAFSIYLAKAGGITGARKVAAIAESANIPCDVNGSLESAIGNAANVHFALSTRSVSSPCVIPISAPAGMHPNTTAGNYYEDDLITEPFKVENGEIKPFDKPGLGIDIDSNKVEEYRDKSAR